METRPLLYTLTDQDTDGAISVRFRGNDVFCVLREYTAADLARFEAFAKHFYMHIKSAHVTWVGNYDPTPYSTSNEEYRVPTLSDLLINDGEPVGAVLLKEAIAADLSSDWVSSSRRIDEDEYIDVDLSLRRLLPPENYMGAQWKIRTYTVAAGITELPAKAFLDWTALEEVSLPEGITRIDASAFEGCRSLRHITLPESLVSIGKHAFRNCVSLEQITLPEGVTQLGNGVFSKCPKLTRISLPAGLTQIGANAFPSLALETVQVTPGSFAEAYCRANYVGQYGYVTLPEGTTAIGKRQFANLPIRGIHLPEGLLTIGLDAFYGCTALRKITLPASLERVESDAFCCCEALEEVTILNPRCDFDRNVLPGHNRLHILIPPGTDLIHKLRLPFSSNIRYSLIGGGTCKRELHYVIEYYPTEETDSDTCPGRILYDCGSCYTGRLKNDRYEGMGLLEDGKGFRYTGTFRNFRFHGEGKITYADGAVLEGEFRNGWPCNAHGVFAYRDWIRLEGTWTDGVFTGSGTYGIIISPPELWEPERSMAVPERISGQLDPTRFRCQTLEGSWENGRFTGTTQLYNSIIKWVDGVRQSESSEKD